MNRASQVEYERKYGAKIVTKSVMLWPQSYRIHCFACRLAAKERSYDGGFWVQFFTTQYFEIGV